MRAVLSGEQRVQRKYPRVRRFTKRQWRERMGAPSQRTDHMAEMFHRREGGIQRRAADGVDDQVEPLAVGAGFHILLDHLLAVVYGRRTQAGDDFPIALTGRRPNHSRSEGTRLNSSMTHPAGS